MTALSPIPPIRRSIWAALAAVSLAQPLRAQADWRETAAHLGTSARILFVGTRPEEADNALIALLGRRDHVETAYLSVTRGESGLNVFSAERSAALAVVRTAELLAERQRDGARQYFTRAFDIGPADADSVVAAAWPRDSLLVDIVSVIRAFRPHVIVALTSTTGERDATRRYIAELVADAFTTAADTTRLPAPMTADLGAWRAARLFAAVDTLLDAPRTLSLDVGAFDQRAMRTYAEIGAETRLLQRTQPLRPAPTVGPLRRLLLRLDRGEGGADALFGVPDTTLARFDAVLPDTVRAQFDSLRTQLVALERDARTATRADVAASLAEVVARSQAVTRVMRCRAILGMRCSGIVGDLAAFVTTLRERATRAMLDAAGIVIDAVAARSLIAPGDSVPITITVRNTGAAPVTLRAVLPTFPGASASGDVPRPVVLAPDSTIQFTSGLVFRTTSVHWWQELGLQNGTQLHGVIDPARTQLVRGEDRLGPSGISAQVTIAGIELPITVGPLGARARTALRGDVRQPLIGVQPTSLLFERGVEYERAGLPVTRLFRVLVSSARESADTLQLVLKLPTGLRADSAVRTIALPPFGTRNVFFALHGTLPAGSAVVTAGARSLRATPGAIGGAEPSATVREYASGTVISEYPHIPSQHFVRLARDRIEAVALRVPPTLRVGYVRGAEDVRAALTQLRLDVTPIDLSLLPAYDLRGFTTLLLGSGALLRPEVAAAAVPALQAFLTRGGTVVLLGGGAEVSHSGLLPYPLEVEPARGRAVSGSSDVRVSDARSPLLTWPNAITLADYAAWNGDRLCSRVNAIDPRYRVPLTVAAAAGRSETPALVTTTVGSGTLVYSALCLGPQLEGAQTGAARIIANLLSAGLRRP